MAWRIRRGERGAERGMTTSAPQQDAPDGRPDRGDPFRGHRLHPVELGVPLVVPLAAVVFLAAFIPLIGILFADALAIGVALATKGWVAALTSAVLTSAALTSRRRG